MVDIVGAGRVGTALHQRALAQGLAGAFVSRHAGWEGLDEAQGRPILVATRNDALADVVARVPEPRHADLVFVQNGMIRPLLADLGVPGATRGILYFAVAARGDDLTVGGASPFVGPMAAPLVAWLRELDVAAEVVNTDAFKAVELEKLLWNSVFGLMCQAKDATVGAVCDEHADELAQLTRELFDVGAPALGVEPAFGAMLARMVAYSQSIPTYQGAVKEWTYRNGWFVDVASDKARTLPLHAQLLGEAGVQVG